MCKSLQLEAGDVTGHSVVYDEVVHRDVLPRHHLDHLLGHHSAKEGGHRVQFCSSVPTNLVDMFIQSLHGSTHSDLTQYCGGDRLQPTNVQLYVRLRQTCSKDWSASLDSPPSPGLELN